MDPDQVLGSSGQFVNMATQIDMVPTATLSSETNGAPGGNPEHRLLHGFQKCMIPSGTGATDINTGPLGCYWTKSWVWS